MIEIVHQIRTHRMRERLVDLHHLITILIIDIHRSKRIFLQTYVENDPLSLSLLGHYLFQQKFFAKGPNFIGHRFGGERNSLKQNEKTNSMEFVRSSLLLMVLIELEDCDHHYNICFHRDKHPIRECPLCDLQIERVRKREENR